jgi:hypothetical protein
MAASASVRSQQFALDFLKELRSQLFVVRLGSLLVVHRTLRGSTKAAQSSPEWKLSPAPAAHWTN